MSRHFQTRVVSSLICLVVFISLSATNAHAQRRGNSRLFGAIPAVSLAQLDEVKTALKLNDEQKKEAAALQEQLNTGRRDLFQNANGDFEAMSKGIAKLYAESRAKLNAKLDESQVKRLDELYAQVNGPIILLDEPIIKLLNITADQKAKLEQARDESRSKMFAAFQDFQNMSEDERAKKGAELVKARDDSHWAVLNEEQKAQFEKLKGEKLDIDLSKLPIPGR